MSGYFRESIVNPGFFMSCFVVWIFYGCLMLPCWHVFSTLPAAMKDVEFLLANHQDELGNKLIDVVICECQMLARMGYYKNAADRMRELTNRLARLYLKRKYS